MPRRSAKQSPAEKRVVAKIHNQIFGGKFVPPADPPTSVINPWNAILLTFDIAFPVTPPQSGVNPGVYRVHGSDIKKQLGTQLGLDLAGVNLLLRLEAISVWKLTSGPIGLMPADPFGGDDSNALTQIEDSPARNAWARAGYRYPDNIRTRPWFVKSDVTTNCGQIVVASPTDKAEVLIHLRTLYRFDTAAWPESSRTLKRGEDSGGTSRGGWFT